MALVSLSEFLLTVHVGDSLPPRHELAKRAGVGIGTLERAFGTLIVAEAVSLDSVPRAGTRVARIDYGALWRFAGRSILRGQLPLNLAVEMGAIEDALESAFTSRGLEVSLVYREGAGRRAAAIARSLSDFAVMSRSSFDTFPGSFSAVFGFGPGSYYGTIGLYQLRRHKGGPVRRVGVDRESPDHMAMVTQEFPSAEVVGVPFRLIPPQIVSQRLDATVSFGGMPLPVQYMTTLRAEPLDIRASQPLEQRSRHRRANSWGSAQPVRRTGPRASQQDLQPRPGDRRERSHVMAETSRPLSVAVLGAQHPHISRLSTF